MGQDLAPQRKQGNSSTTGFAIFLLILACVGFVWVAFEIMSMQGPL